MKRSKSPLLPASLPPAGLLRLPAILALIPISRSSWFSGIKAGKFPKPVKLGARISAWRVQDIKPLIERPVHVTSEDNKMAHSRLNQAAERLR
jgi:prophage regulatory protein